MRGLVMLILAAAVAGGGAAAAQPGDLFAPIYAVIQHPRCTNCHAAGDLPLQRDSRPHVPPVRRGSEGKGTAQSPCRKCHTDRNTASAPGAPPLPRDELVRTVAVWLRSGAPCPDG